MNRWQIKREVETLHPIGLLQLICTLMQALSDKKVFDETELRQMILDANRMSTQ
jgi:hypothetical protein